MVMTAVMAVKVVVAVLVVYLLALDSRLIQIQFTQSQSVRVAQQEVQLVKVLTAQIHYLVDTQQPQ
jgi:hypothetical protein